MVILDIDHNSYHYYFNSDRYLLLISFADWLAVAIMLIAALSSLGTASILPKTSFDFMFHFIMSILMLIGGLWVAVSAFNSNYRRSTYIQAGCVCCPPPNNTKQTANPITNYRSWLFLLQSFSLYMEYSRIVFASPTEHNEYRMLFD